MNDKLQAEYEAVDVAVELARIHETDAVRIEESPETLAWEEGIWVQAWILVPRALLPEYEAETP